MLCLVGCWFDVGMVVDLVIKELLVLGCDFCIDVVYFVMYVLLGEDFWCDIDFSDGWLWVCWVVGLKDGCCVFKWVVWCEFMCECVGMWVYILEGVD